jgi:hypothetical protein
MSSEEVKLFHRRVLRKVREVLYSILEDEFGENVSYNTKETSIEISGVTVKEVKEALERPSWRKNLWH